MDQSECERNLQDLKGLYKRIFSDYFHLELHLPRRLLEFVLSIDEPFSKQAAYQEMDCFNRGCREDVKMNLSKMVDCGILEEKWVSDVNYGYKAYQLKRSSKDILTDVLGEAVEEAEYLAQ